MTVADTTTAASESASDILAKFVQTRALQTRRELGFGWLGTPAAPSTYQQLRAAFARSLSTGEPLPISDEFCNTSIYPQSRYNVMFRFWHDVSHIRLGLSFNLEDELELALWHLSELEIAGHCKGSEVYALFEADLVGQVLLYALIRRFPISQRTFAERAQAEGLVPGVLAETRRLT